MKKTCTDQINNSESRASRARARAHLALLPFALLPFISCASVIKAQQPAATSTQSREITQAQADLYERWRSNINMNQQAAYEAGRDYLTKFPGDEYASYVARWVEAYVRAARRLELARLFKQQDFAGLFRTGKVILADEPDDLKTINHLAYAGYLAAGKGNDSFSADALGYARRAIGMIESGAKPVDWQPFVDQPDALAYLNFVVGELTFKEDPATSASIYLKALTYDSTLRRAPVIYSRLAAAHVISRYDPLSKDYEARYSGKDPTDESRAALEKIRLVVDQIIDAYARAVALSAADPKYAEAKRRWMDELTRFYKFRHDDSTEGLDALISSIASKPLPENK
ncbi:MAG: hypothetical protein QOE33_3445 [Acidobacteriota bacterium]|nr:hypothetical protein [Acidobacteriota bacterium]